MLRVNASSPGQVMIECCRAEAMDVTTGVISCAAVEKNNRIYFADSLEVLTDKI
jgi:hypothetical protein